VSAISNAQIECAVEYSYSPYYLSDLKATDIATHDYFPTLHPLEWIDCFSLLHEKEIEPVVRAYIRFHESIARGIELIADYCPNLDMKNEYPDYDIYANSLRLLFPNYKRFRVDSDCDDFIQWTWFIKNTHVHYLYDSPLYKMPYRQYLSTVHWKRIRYSMILLNGAKCAGEDCKDDIGHWESLQNLHVHHLTYKNRGHEYVEDLKLLCASCHAKEHGIDR
jgi:hypothetical protein